MYIKIENLQMFLLKLYINRKKEFVNKTFNNIKL